MAQVLINITLLDRRALPCPALIPKLFLLAASIDHWPPSYQINAPEIQIHSIHASTIYIYICCMSCHLIKYHTAIVPGSEYICISVSLSTPTTIAVLCVSQNLMKRLELIALVVVVVVGVKTSRWNNSVLNVQTDLEMWTEHPWSPQSGSCKY